MSLLDKASLIVTPNGYKEGKLYSVIPSDGSGDLSVTRATTATRVNSAGLVESMGNNIPRLDYSNGTCPSILVEPQRTNLLTYSSSFDNAAYSSSGTGTVTVTANYGIAPDGTTSADRIQITRGSTYQERFQRPSTTIGQSYTLSFWAKSLSGTPTLYTAFNNGYVNEITFTTEWVRYEYTYTAASASSGFNLITWTNLAGTSASADILVWGAQLEAGSYATSYIPTTSASVTRNADVISKTGISSLIGQTEGTVYIDTYIDNISAQTNDPVLIYLKGTSVETYIEIFDNGLVVALHYNGTTQCSIQTASGFLTNGRHKFAFGYKANDFVFYIDGVLIGTDTSGSVGAQSELGLQYYSSSVSGAQDVNSAILFKERLTNDELATLTTI